MVPPPPTYINVGIAGVHGGSVYGSCSDGNVYLTHQVNIPFGSELLADSSNVNVGYITDKVITNDQSDLLNFPGKKN